MVLSRENTTRILNILRDNPQGLSITDMVKKIGINRNTSGRYLENLLVSGKVEMRHFGMAKIYTLANRMPQSAMLSISSDLVMQLDSGLRIVFANEPFLNLLKVSSPDLIGKNFEYSAAVPVFEDTLENIITILKNGIAGKEWHGTLLVNKGDRFFSCSVTPAVFHDGRKGVSVRLEDLTELRHHEHALQESEARLRSIIGAAPIGIGMVSGRVLLEVNNHFCQMTGYEAGDLIGRSARLLYPTQEEFDRVGRVKYAQMGRTGSSTVQARWKKKDGSFVDVLLSSAPLDPADLTRGITFTALDITQSTRAERDLRESEERFRKLIEISPDAVILHADGKILYVNPAAQELIGVLGPEKMVGKSVLDFIEPNTRDAVRVNISKDLAGDLSPPMELQMLRLDGTSVIVEGRGAKTLIEGKPAVMVAIRNITERKLAEEKLVGSERKYRFLTENSLDIITRQTPECVLTYVSPVFRSVLGYSEDEVLGKSLLEMVHPEDLGGVMGDMQRIISKGNTRATASFRFRHRDGHYLWFESTTNVIRDEQSGKILEFFSIPREITERKLLEKELSAGAERYRHLAECSLDAQVITDPAGNVLTTNRAALTLFELDDPEAVRGCPVFRFIAPESLENARRDFASMGPDRKAIMQTYTGITAKGNRITIEVLGNRIVFEGRAANIISVRDVSSRTITEKNLTRSEQMYRDLADNSLDIINHHDARFILTYISPAVKTILGYEPEDAIGRCILDFICPEDIPAMQEMHDSLVRKETDTATLVYRMVHKDGNMVWLESTIRAIPNPLTGEVTEFYNVTRDITLRKFAQDTAHHRDRLLHGFAAASGFLLTGRLKDPIPRVLATIGEAIKADIAYIYEDTGNSPSRSHIPLRKFHWVAKTGEMDSTPSTHHACGDKFSREWAERLAAGAWVTGIRSRFPEPIRQMLYEMGVLSILIVPIHVGNVYWGFIGFSDTRTERLWSDTEIEITMTLAKMMGIVLGMDGK